jgi:hypothetical protein
MVLRCRRVQSQILGAANMLLPDVAP